MSPTSSTAESSELLPGERRELVASQRDVATYDRKPQMSAREITDAFIAAFDSDRPAFSVINFANADMVGHTGVDTARRSSRSRRSTSVSAGSSPRSIGGVACA